MDDKQHACERQKGMLTVEAAFIVPIMILSVLGVIYLSVLLYQNTVATAEATRSANRIAAYWSYLAVDAPPALQNGTQAEALIDENSYADRSPYRFILETISLSGGKRLQNGNQYAQTRIAAIPFEAYTDGNPADVTVRSTTGFLSSYIEVSFTKGYINPLGNLMSKIGIGSKQDYTAKATAIITNPTEFIRNVDVLYDIGTSILGKLKGN